MPSPHNPRPWIRAALCAVSLSALALAGPSARAAGPDGKANPGDAALAEALFKEARDLMRDKNYAAACPKFAESYRLDAALGSLLNLASCHELEGKVATAWGEYRDAEAQALRTNDKSRQKFAKDHAEALEPRLPKLVLSMSAPPDGLEVKRDGATLGSASLGTPLPIDPGEHDLAAVAPQRKPWSKKVTAREGQLLRVEIPELEPAPEEAPQEGPRAGGKPGGPGPGGGGGGTSGRVLAGVVIGAVGVAGLAAGGVFVGLTASKKSEADSNECDADKKCTDAGVTLIGEAETFANAANIALGAGGALVIVGGILILTGLGDDAPASEGAAPSGRGGAGLRRISVLPAVGPDGGGVVARLRF